MNGQHLNQVAIVLVQPQDVVNVAAVIRLMSNFGLPDLRLVEPAAFDPHRILGIAHGTEPLVASVRRFATLEAALADCALVLGTTGRPRTGQRNVVSPRQAAPLLLGAPGSGAPGSSAPGSTAPGSSGTPRAAVLFGPEQDGLANAALEQCHGVIAIQTHSDNRSLNLAQAALVIAYELWTQAGEQVAQTPPTPAPDLAVGMEREAMFGALSELLSALYPGSTKTRMTGALARWRTLLMRAGPTREEALAVANLWRHITHRLSGPASDPQE